MFKKMALVAFYFLPSTDADGKSYVGSIDVSTLGGKVTLDQAYEATTVTTAILLLHRHKL
jgi:hypothetical protein